MFLTQLKGRMMTRNRRYSLIFSCAAALVLATGSLYTTYAQENQPQQGGRKWGLGAAFQGGNQLLGQQFIIVPVWLRSKLVVGPVVSVTHTENVNLNFTAGLATRFYLTLSRVSPFWGVAATTTYNKPQLGGAASAPVWTFGGYFGGEFFINQRFSLIILQGVWVLRPLRGGNLTITSATFFMGTVYF
jgi:hypothetical protein